MPLYHTVLSCAIAVDLRAIHHPRRGGQETQQDEEAASGDEVRKRGAVLSFIVRCIFLLRKNKSTFKK